MGFNTQADRPIGFDDLQQAFAIPEELLARFSDPILLDPAITAN
jgi:hypothetical protein